MQIKNGFTKYDLYEIVSNKSELAQSLPPAQLFSDFNDMISFIEKYGKVILKPLNYYNEERICIIEKLESSFKITDCRGKKNIRLSLESIEELRNYLKSNETEFEEYIIQKHIKLAKIEETPFDIRTVMKKTALDKWNIKGFECRVGGSNFLFNNICKESFAPLNEAVKKYYPLHFNFGKKVNEIYELCLKACSVIDECVDYSEELRFDIAIDEENKIWIMDINMVDSLKRFFVVDYNTYLSIKYTPLLYNVSAYNSKNK
jgi:hypothetical protein